MYAREITEASKSALLEISLELKRYRTDMVLSGGWAPYFITNGYFEHCGSIDIDLVLRTKIMKKYEINEIYSNDTDFDRVKGLKRIWE